MRPYMPRNPKTAVKLGRLVLQGVGNSDGQTNCGARVTKMHMTPFQQLYGGKGQRFHRLIATARTLLEAS